MNHDQHHCTLGLQRFAASACRCVRLPSDGTETLGAMRYASNLNPNCQKLMKRSGKDLQIFSSLIAFKIILILSHRLRFCSSFSRPHSPRYGTRSYSAEALIGVTPCLHGSTPHASQHAIHQLLTVQELLGERVD